MFELRTLGTLDLRSEPEGRRLVSVLAQPKRAALLVYLGLAGARGRTREAVMAMFWPELPPPRARHALSQALHVLRGSLAENAIRSVGGQVVLAAEVVRCDAAAFEQALDGGRAEEALELYRGEFLEGFHLVDGAPAFERWVDAEREQLARRALEAALALAEREQHGGNPAGAARWLNRARRLAPYDEQVLERTLHALAAAGDRSGVVREYRAFEEQLRQELELEPSPATRTLIQRVLEQQLPQPEPAPAEMLSPRPPHAPLPRTPAPTPPSARRSRWRTPASAVLLVLLLAAAMFALLSRPSASAPERQVRDSYAPPRVLVLDFRDDTAEPGFATLGRIAADWIARGLARSGMVEVIPSSLAGVSLHSPSTTNGAGGASGGFDLRALAQQTGSDYVIWGSYLRQRDSLVIHAAITEAASGRLLRTLPPLRTHIAEPMAGVHELQDRVGGGLATVLDARMASWAGAASQPPSFPAYQLFTDGIERFASGQYEVAADAFLRAAATDSSFTAALVWAMHAMAWETRVFDIDSLASVLLPRRDELAPWDRALLDFYRAQSLGDWRDAYEAAVRLARLAPRSDWAWYPRVHGALALGRPREALSVLLELGPESAIHWTPYWGLRTGARHLIGDYASELEDVELARRDPSCCDLDQSHYLAVLEMGALAGLGRTQEVLRRLDDHLATAAERHHRVQLIRGAADELRRHGFPELAQALAERELALRGARLDDHEAPAQRYQLGRAFHRAGRFEEAFELLDALERELALQPRALPRPGILIWRVRGYLALSAAARGDRETAIRIAEHFAAFDTPPFYHFFAPTWQARIADALGERERAVAILNRAFEDRRMGFASWMHTDPELGPLFDHPALRGREREAP